MKLKLLTVQYEVPATEDYPTPRYLTIETENVDGDKRPTVFITLSGQEPSVLRPNGKDGKARSEFNAILNKLPDEGNFREEVLHLVREHVRTIEPGYIKAEVPFYSAVHGI
jgi:hypothetical protein